MYFREPDKILVGSLHLITSDDDVMYMVDYHTRHFIVHLYIVCFGDGQGDKVESEEDDDEEEVRVDFNDPWWKDKVSDDEDLFNVDVDLDDNRAETSGAAQSGDGDVDCDNENEGDEEDESDDEAHPSSDGVRSKSGSKKKGTFEALEDDDTNSEMGRIDILESPHISDEEGIRMFRDAAKEYNLRRGKKIRFKRNKRRECIVVCRDEKYRYRVYARHMPDEQSFQIRSTHPKHLYGRKYKNSIVNSTWIANKLIEKFRIQPNMPLNVIQHEVKEKWKVDVTPSMMYRTINIMVDRPNPSVLPKFGRLYLSLAAMKKGFLEGYRPVIGVDGCFLKGPLKGQLLATVGRDVNNTTYAIAFAIVEAKTKDSWI
ncbi:uncharacterized protein LOC132174284 [Corylus avellana]|uniref:uncharacterized protein LOC132174284 n=1 Tax=Corylus avellana TaxID=13451 RepID=UPI00286B8243|nr:uncharacterized protein LOC132174284 [Corylus avellana]